MNTAIDVVSIDDDDDDDEDNDLTQWPVHCFRHLLAETRVLAKSRIR